MASSRRRPAANRPRRAALWLPLGALVVVGVAVAAAFAGRGGGGGGSGGANRVLAVGARAPSVRLPATTGQSVDLAAGRGGRNVLLYFYEHAG